jgi:Holliday junction resolvase RusA-like endonuclease
VIEFTVPGDAVPWARAGGGRNTPRFTPAKQRNYMGALRMFCAAAMKGKGPLTGPIELSVLAVYGWPTSWSSKKRALPGADWKTSRPDADNLSKIVKDALNTVAWSDDALVTSLHVWKRFGDVPRLSVRIRSLACPADISASSPPTSLGATA